uniref:Uncharacterized protein n=1 Tax=Anguilla anguilla TaxID=7936 RepID=A0A0E9UG27_ANGAN
MYTKYNSPRSALLAAAVLSLVPLR